MNTIQIGRGIMILGAVLLVVGGGVYLAGKFGVPLGRLPGDIRIERENFTCVFPLATMILVSVLLTIVLNLLTKWLNK
jgi:predicted MFS family arabinose efflux permease